MTGAKRSRLPRLRFVCSAAAAHAAGHFESPCECRDPHGKDRLALQRTILQLRLRMPAHSIGLKSYRRIAAHRTKLGFSMKTKRFALLALLTLAGAVPAFSETSFTPTGVIDMIPTSMSDDASIVVGTGTSGVPNLYYTEAGGAVVIGDGCFSGLPAISGDGTTVLGCHTDQQGLWNAARWLGGTSWLDLGTVAGGIPCDLLSKRSLRRESGWLACRRSALFSDALQSQCGHVGPDQWRRDRPACRIRRDRLYAGQRRQCRRKRHRRLAGSTNRRTDRREMGEGR